MSFYLQNVRQNKSEHMKKTKFLIYTALLFLSFGLTSKSLEGTDSCGCDEQEIKYNPHSDKWEIIGEDAETKYNPHEDRWEFACPDANLVYNAHEDKWEYNSKYTLQA